MALLNENAYDRRAVKAVYKQDGTRGHHMQVGLECCLSTTLSSGTPLCCWQAGMWSTAPHLLMAAPGALSCCFCKISPLKLHLQHSPAPLSRCPSYIIHLGRCLALAHLDCICRTLSIRPVLCDYCTNAFLLHLQDFIPQEELAKVLAKSGNAADQAQAAQLEQQSRIQADNVGHKCVRQLTCRRGTCP